MSGTTVAVDSRSEALALTEFLREQGYAASISRADRKAGALALRADATQAERSAHEAALGGFIVDFYAMSGDTANEPPVCAEHYDCRECCERERWLLGRIAALKAEAEWRADCGEPRGDAMTTNATFCGVCGTDAEFGHADNCSAYVDELLAKLDAAKAEAERRAAIDRECVERGCLFTGTPPCCSRCGRYDRTGMQARADLATALTDLDRASAEIEQLRESSEALKDEAAALREAMDEAADLVRSRVEESDNEREESDMGSETKKTQRKTKRTLAMEARAAAMARRTWARDWDRAVGNAQRLVDVQTDAFQRAYYEEELRLRRVVRAAILAAIEGDR